ncbi:MAG: PQQ-dependent sugar dehydrogenase [Gemmatimonadaceae bacterium]|jgi:glucose/arabinose dehydrogenase|nr:PQQ-dependent sugar dehydrogenase [Gemmatimonadaceae bacterium]
MMRRRTTTRVSCTATGLVMSLCLVATLSSCTGSSSRSLERGEALSSNTTSVSFRVVPVADGIRYPLSVAFLPDSSLLVAEKFGTLRRVRGGVVSAPIVGVPSVYTGGQGGLHEVALHPDFVSNGLVYLAYAKALNDGLATTALARGRLEGDTLRDVQELFVARTDSRAGQHFGGRIAFDGAGHLFLSVGDRGASPSGDLERHPAQDLSNHQGTIVRLTLDGAVPPDNPFVTTPNARPEIWSYGHRNPQGLVYDAASGTLWETEHGPRGGDELNRVRAGANYGWPVITYGRNYSGTSITSERERAGMEQPVTYWVPSIATSGLLVYTGGAFPAWRGSLFVGGLAGEQLARVSVDGVRKTGEETLLRGSVGRIRDVRQGPDGFIYLALDRDGGPGTIVRLEPGP